MRGQVLDWDKIPIPATFTHRLAAAVEPFDFDLTADGKAALRRSADRYLRAIEPRSFPTE
jgi:hypothetical protein